MDFFRFCAFRVPDMQNMEDIVKCMDAHVDELQEPCKMIVQNATAALAGFHAACDPSLKAVCPEAIGNTQHTGLCLVQHLAALSSPCLSEISKLMLMRMQHRGPPGPHPPPPSMDGFSTGLGADAFDFSSDFFGPNDDFGPGGRVPHGGPHGGPHGKQFLVGMAGECRFCAAC
jgi:hypothetical protein